MDYDIINQVYEEIITIVNNFIRRTNCSYEIARKLSFALLGYYLVLGPEIFKKINIVLDAVNIYECTSEEEYCEYTGQTLYNDGYDEPVIANPVTMWDFKFNEEKSFLGGIPKIVYMRANEFQNVLSLAHEISHVLEGASAKITKEDREKVYVKYGFASIEIERESGHWKFEEGGFSELAAVSLENRIVSALLKLEVDKITSPILQDFLNSIKNYENKNTMSRSYTTMSISFKDFMDNDAFYDLVKNYFYETDEQGFKAEYESLSPTLDFKSLKKSANILSKSSDNLKLTMFYQELVQKQATTFAQATNFTPEKKLLILV